MCTYCVQGSTVCQNLKGLWVLSDQIRSSSCYQAGQVLAITKLDFFMRSQESQCCFLDLLDKSEQIHETRWIQHCYFKRSRQFDAVKKSKNTPLNRHLFKVKTQTNIFRLRLCNKLYVFVQYYILCSTSTIVYTIYEIH